MKINLKNMFMAIALSAFGASANASIITTTISLDSFITVTRSGAAPASDANFSDKGGTDFFVRGRRGGALNNNPQLETQLFFTFDLSSVASYLEFSDATLYLNQNNRLNSVNANAELFLATAVEDWNTGSNLPAFDSTLVKDEFKFGANGSGSIEFSQAFEIDLSALVESWINGTQENFGLRMRIEDEFAAASFLLDSANAPRLVINQVPEPSTIAFLALGLIGLGVRRFKS